MTGLYKYLILHKSPPEGQDRAERLNVFQKQHVICLLSFIMFLARFKLNHDQEGKEK